MARIGDKRKGGVMPFPTFCQTGSKGEITREGAAMEIKCSTHCSIGNTPTG